MNTRNATLASFARTVTLIALLCALAVIQTSRAATIVVTSTADDGSPGTLRAALAAAVDGDIIDATGVTGTITLLPQFLTSSQLAVTTSVTIVGPGPDNLTIDGNRTSRVFRIFPGREVTIDGFTITNGLASGAPQGSFPGNDGGGIYNDHSVLTVSNCRIVGNSAERDGGGIYNGGSLSGSATARATDSRIESNTCGRLGGAIMNDGTNSGSATLVIGSSSLRGNRAGEVNESGGGGAVFSDGSGGIVAVEVFRSTFAGNTAGNNAGAIRSIAGSGGGGGAAFLSLTNSTFSGNSSVVGGAVLIDGIQADITALIFNCTFSGNSATVGSSIVNTNGRLHIGGSILKAGAPGTNIVNDFNGVVVSHGFNLSSDDAGGHLTASGDQINSDPMLGPLADNGGPTFTHLPLLGSPAIDGSSSDILAVFGVTTDQRGLARTVDSPSVPNAVLGDGTDIGAVEVSAAPPPPPSAPVADVGITFHGADKTSVKQGEVLTYTIAVRNFGPDTAPNVVVNDLMSSGTGFLNARATKGSFAAPPVNESGAVVWNLGDMANGAAEGAELTVSVLVKGKTTVTNLVVVNSDAEDPDAENNVASITTSVAAGGSNGGGGGKKK